MLCAALMSACSAPEKREEHSLSELGQLLGNSQPVRGTQVEGAEPLETGDPYALAEPQTVTPPPKQEPAVDPYPRQDPYIRFGERIIVRKGVGGETFITKPYTMPATKADKLVQLLNALEPFPFRARPKVDPASGQPPPPLDPGMLEYEILAKWDEEIYSNLKVPPDGSPPAPAVPQELSDLFVVTASYGLLEQFEDFLDLFAAGGVPQIELEAKIIEVVEKDQLDVGVKGGLTFGSKNFVQSFNFDLPNLANGTEALLNLGAVQSNLAFSAVIEAIRTWDNVQIESQPKTVVRAGGVAYIESATEIPFAEIKTISTNATDFTAATVYKKVGVQMYISPRIIGTKMLALDVHLIGSQQVGTQVTFTTSNGQNFEVPVIAYRTAKTMVYLEPGQTLLIGGLTTQRDRELVNKVPVLGDIPLIGLLFRSRFTQSEKQHVLFAISPRILQPSDFESEF